MANERGPGSKLPPVLEGFGAGRADREAALSEYGKQFEGVEIGLLDDEIDPVEQARKTAATAQPAAPAKTDQPNLEPISDQTHRHRRIPTQPPSALQLQLDDGPLKPGPRSEEGPRPSTPLPPPPTLGPRHSPAPVRPYLLSDDRITNLLGCAAIGLLLTIFPARQLARNYEAANVEPLIAELEGAVEHPLGVEAGLVTKPETIAAQIEAGRGKVRTRYAMIWLLVGLPIGVGLGFLRRP